jgi:hypothetical protein
VKLSACFVLFAAATAFCSGQSTQLNLNPPLNSTPGVRVFPAPRSMNLESQQRQIILGPGNPAEISQRGCPVVLTDVSLQAKARYMPVDAASPNADSPSLALEFRNMSGKAILSVAIEAQLKFKRSIYDLDSTPFNLYLTLPGTAITKEANQQERLIPLRVPASGIAGVTLQRVMYTDGSVWVAEADNSCRMGPTSAERIVAR